MLGGFLKGKRTSTMRSCFLSLIWMVGGTAVAQDAAQQAVQIQQQQQQIVQQQIAQQQLDLINQQQLNEASIAGLGGYRIGVRAPRLEKQAGTEPGTVVVRMEDPSRGASIFYTTDGWTPTGTSARYMGPITIRESVTVRAIAIAAGGLRSHVSVFPVQLGANASAPQGSNALRIQTLEPGVRLPLIFAASVTSQGKRVGDRLPVCLADDVFVNGKLAAAKGTSVDAVVTQVDNSHVQGLPGVLSFSVQSIRLEGGATVPLLGVETMEGADHEKKAGIVSILPFGGLAVHGGDALISAGTRLEAEVKGPLTPGIRPESE